MNSLKSWRVLLLTAIVIALCASCSKSDKNPVSSHEDPLKADSLVQAANAQLGNELYNLANGPDVQRPGDVDLSAAYNLYVQALGYQGNHTGANFGAGMLELIMLSRDSDVQTFFDRCKTMFDSANYFEVGQGGRFMGGAPQAPQPVMRLDQVSLPVLAPLKMLRGMCRTLDDNGPTVAELQQICVGNILPRVQTATQRLSVVAANRQFTFIITPHMQGDDGEDPMYMDQTEVCFTLAVLNGLEAMLQHFCAYDLNLAAYDSSAMIAALSQGSSFGRLKADGTSRMQAARTAWLNATTNLDSAVSFLEHETGDQSHHVIHLDPYDHLTQADLDTITTYLPQVKNALNSSQVFSLDTDGNSNTPAEDVEISLAAFFNSPISDVKALFPAYTVTLGTQYDEHGTLRYTPRITWQADDFTHWILPNPTLGGLLPGMTDTHFKQVFNIREEDWQKTSTWNLW